MKIDLNFDPSISRKKTALLNQTLISNIALKFWRFPAFFEVKRTFFTLKRCRSSIVVLQRSNFVQKSTKCRPLRKKPWQLAWVSIFNTISTFLVKAHWAFSQSKRTLRSKFSIKVFLEIWLVLLVIWHNFALNLIKFAWNST